MVMLISNLRQEHKRQETLTKLVTWYYVHVQITCYLLPPVDIFLMALAIQIHLDILSNNWGSKN